MVETPAPYMADLLELIKQQIPAFAWMDKWNEQTQVTTQNRQNEPELHRCRQPFWA
jgi:hypothetical protein